MALFPQGYANVDARCNAGERRVLQQLKRCLEDDAIVWHDVPIGPRARQPDFVVLSPRWGVLLLEVKDWKAGAIAGGTRDAVELDTARGRVTVPHPLRQARDVVLELVHLMQADAQLVHGPGLFAGRLLFPYGWGVAMSRLRADDVAGTDFAALFPRARTLLRDDLDPGLDVMAFQQRLWGLFTVSYPHTLTLPQRDRIRWHLFPEVRLATQVALPLDDADDDPLPDLMAVMDLQQEQVARSLGDGHRVIHGAAGSGKTMILVYRASFLAAAAPAGAAPILVLCFNRALATRIAATLRGRGVDDGSVQVRTFHSWCQDMVRSYHVAVPAARSDGAYFDALASALERAVETGRVPGGQYRALLIDEAHDFDDAWLRMAARMVDPATSSLLVLYDDAQSIYQARRRKFNFASVGIEARGRTSILRVNYRNTAEVLALALRCAAGLVTGARGDDEIPLVEPASAGRRGPLPVLIEAPDAGAEAEALGERIAALLAAGSAPDDIAILTRTRALMAAPVRALRRRGIALQSMHAQAFRQFDWRQPSVKLLTMHSAKGLEFAHVFVAGLQALPREGGSDDDALRLLYVAMTRATQSLVLSASGPSRIVDRVRDGVAAVARRFAER